MNLEVPDDNIVIRSASGKCRSRIASALSLLLAGGPNRCQHTSFAPRVPQWRTTRTDAQLGTTMMLEQRVMLSISAPRPRPQA